MTYGVNNWITNKKIKGKILAAGRFLRCCRVQIKYNEGIIRKMDVKNICCDALQKTD